MDQLRNKRLTELALVFLKLGTVAFGGPAAHVAMMDEQIVRRRRWLTQQEFLDYFSATNFIPGPNSTEMAIHIGHRRAGWLGLIVAGTCFILPAATIVTAIGWAYVKFGRLPQAAGLLYGIKPVVIAIILQALWKLGRTALKNRWLALIAIVAVFLSAVRVNELLILVIGGIAAFPWTRFTFDELKKRGGSAAAWMPISGGVGAAAGGMSVGLWPMFLIFAKIGSVLFGSGYVLLAFLRADLVERYHWLTQQQLLDAVAVGQVTPGPLFTTPTFIGYILHCPSGALVATLGIFHTGFFFVAVSAPLLPRLRSSVTAGNILDGINVASLALMIVVTYQLGRAAILDWRTVSIVVASLLILYRYRRVNSVWLVMGGGLFGLLTHVACMPQNC